MKIVEVVVKVKVADRFPVDAVAARVERVVRREFYPTSADDVVAEVVDTAMLPTKRGRGVLIPPPESEFSEMWGKGVPSE